MNRELTEGKSSSMPASDVINEKLQYLLEELSCASKTLTEHNVKLLGGIPKPLGGKEDKKDRSSFVDRTIQDLQELSDIANNISVELRKLSDFI